MCNVYNLPEELLFLIFTKGMEDELDQGKPCFRTLKTFARVLRNVCRHWRFLIDDPVHTSFWITRSVVEMTDRGAIRGGGRSPFAKGLAIFQAQLLTSEGCDLAVFFRTERPSKSGQEVERRLMLHALDMLVPYQNQIIQLRLEGDLTDAIIYLLEQITSRWKMVQRLLEVQFIPWENYEWRALSQSPVHPNFTRLDIPESERPTWLSLPATMLHITTLDRLEIPNASWLNGGLILPHTLRHLRISYGEVETISILYRYLSHNPLCNHLRSITVGPSLKGPEEGETTAKPRRLAWKAEELLIIPHLLKLDLLEAAEGQIMTFIGCLCCPSLDTLSLGWLDSDQSMANLEMVTTTLSLPLENEHRMSLSSTHGNDDVGVKSDVVPFRPQFCPVQLSLRHASYNEVLLILVSADTQCLEVLLVVTSSVRERQVNGTSIPALINWTLDRQVSMPSLKTLELHSTLRNHLHFLMRLSAPDLFSVTITIYGGEYRQAGVESFQDDALAPFPSLKHLRYSLSAPLIPLNLMQLDIFLNLQELRIDYMDYVTEPGRSDLPTFKASIKTLCRALGPSTKGVIPFPNLCFLEIDCRYLRSIDEDSEGCDLTIQESEIHALIDDLLTDRVRLGVLPLYKIDPEISYYLMDRANPKWENFHVRIEARSATSTVHSRDAPR